MSVSWCSTGWPPTRNCRGIIRKNGARPGRKANVILGQTGNFHESERPAAVGDREFLQDRGGGNPRRARRFRASARAPAPARARQLRRSQRTGIDLRTFRDRSDPEIAQSGSAPRHRRARSITCSADFLTKNNRCSTPTIRRAAEAVKCAIDKGLFAAMNLFNQPPEEIYEESL